MSGNMFNSNIIRVYSHLHVIGFIFPLAELIFFVPHDSLENATEVMWRKLIQWK